MGITRAQKRSSNAGFSSLIPKPILLVEDSQTVSNYLSKEIAARWHCNVHVAATYAEAKQLLKQHRQHYHLAICDLNLPDAPHAEIVDLTEKAKLKTIVITGAFGEDLKEAMTHSNVVDFMLKEQINSFEYVIELVGRLYRNQFIEVLVVEDSAVMRAILTKGLELQNFVVWQAAHATDALKMISHNPNIKLVITDYNMPDMDGVELTVAIRRHSKASQLAVIGISAQSKANLGVQFIKNGANDFLSKPFSNEELVCRINQNLDMMKYIETIYNLANKDHLTNLSNRRHFFEVGELALDEAQMTGDDVIVVMLDIDFFKKINDQYGHEAGDLVLVKFAEALQQHFSDHLTARLGGEEFAVMFEGIEEEPVRTMLERFREAVANLNIAYQDDMLSLTVSIGYNPRNCSDLDAMLKIADDALYEAKQQGRNCVIRREPE